MNVYLSPAVALGLHVLQNIANSPPLTPMQDKG